MIDMSVGVLDETQVQRFGALLRQEAARDQGTERANEEVARWAESDARLAEKRRRENRAGWFAYYSRLSQTLHERADECEQIAESLCYE